MTSNRPYLLRALYEWIVDNDMTPYLLVDATREGVQVPPSAIKDERVVLNIAPRAVGHLELGDAEVSFMARFGGVSQPVRAPVAAVVAIYAQETGQGMVLPEDANAAESAPVAEPADAALRRRPELAVASRSEEPDAADGDADAEGRDEDGDGDDTPPPRRGAHLRIVK
ncbi:ClpXP protease specificity-enhancing factor [Coralloluteibacterium stylophorae]|uniref:ClpXP protease specificity-enhancing factor n=1 Tax=Coralloluteibacterium stylophorae TaxID=1776034 RepID=A0A8J8AYP3_9GAMM|nr:ClpXP protease specificity-enhancing factor [Coralloluteibacterium stylophorae]MBS7456676.1 ClpXP protease specificity-enhancing factor [Coralloluteibacterium stylophorae]